ncbi:MAG TPA: alpha/beta fold hydrolase [Vicinamibacteria bacterium]|nr:alpha/beta fold hydrolase [Vicinamibacteria bacterium]
MRFLRPVLAALSRVAPGLAAAAAERVFFTPPRPRPSRGEAALRAGRRFDVRVDGQSVAAWHFGHGPVVVVLHGWAGRAAQMTSFLAPLLGRGLSVVVFDAPGHGRSSGGRSSAVHFARALRAVASEVGPVHAVVAHSLGAAATALALRGGLRVQRVALLGPAAFPPAWFGRFAAAFGIPADVARRAKARSERRLGLRWDDLHVPSLAAAFATPALIVHDLHDDEVPRGDGAAIAAAWPGARLLETSGLGHIRLLRDAAVIDAVSAFVAEGAAPCDCGAPAAEAGFCETCRVGLELFDREARWEAHRAAHAVA